MKSLPLFSCNKDIFYTLLVIVALFCISLGLEYYKYKKVTAYSLHVSSAKVLKDYKKKGKKYRILKLKSDGYTFFTSYKTALHVSRGDELKVIFYTKGISFYKFLEGFYASCKSLHVKSRAKPNGLVQLVQKQHSDPVARELYSALFFAIPLSNTLRQDIAKWGIAHLVAISGFHLGILSGILFFLLKPIYSFFQDRYFPYRNQTADLSLIVIVFLGSYTYFIGMTPSVIRAFIMSVLGFFLFSQNIKVISFGALFFAICAVLILSPHLLFSIAFWFSVSGVFYIFLFLHHFSNLNNVATFVILHFWIYILMLPVVHYVFDVFSLAQLISPLISMLFILFYPLSLALHVVGFGGVMDSLLSWFFALHVEVYPITTPLWFFVSYLMLSLLSIKLRYIALLLPFVSAILFFI